MSGSTKTTLTVVYDNNRYEPRLRTDWGFSCFIQRSETALLFDTGGDGEILLSNMSRLGLDPEQIEHVVLSHIHGDHTDGLSGLLARGIQPVVGVPPSFPPTFKERVRSRTQVHEVSRPARVADGIYSTGELGSAIVEQSLILESDPGLVLITGCAHPGIAEIVARARKLHLGGLHLVVGGFHLGGKSQAVIRQIAGQLKELGVKKLAPCHCTGTEATRLLAQEWGADFVACGVGRIVELLV